MRRYLQPNQVAQVVQLLQEGTSICGVTKRFAVSPSTVSRAWRRYQDTSCYTRRAGQGCRRAWTQQQDHYLLLYARRNRKSTARALQKDQTALCSSIGICRRTQDITGLPLAPRFLHIWEQVHTEHMWHAWKSLVTLWWTLHACHIIQHDQFGGESVMVWGGNGTLTAVGYRDEILRVIVRP